MPWTPLPRLAFAICTYPFVPASPADLPLQIGDELYIIEQGGKDGAWYRGYLVAPPSLLAGLTSSTGQTLEKRVFTGIFPKDCVEIKELLGDASRSSNEGSAVLDGGVRLEHDIVQTVAGQNEKELAEANHASEQDVLKSGAPSTPTSPNQPSTSAHLEGQPPQSPNILPPPDGPNGAPRKPIGQAHGPSSRSKMKKPPAPVPMLKIGDESALAKQEPLVDEIASCLREWHSSKLHELLLHRQYGPIDQMSSLVTRLDYARRQLLNKILTLQELDELREAIIWDLVYGNKILNGDVVVRSNSSRGRILTCDDSPLEIGQLQASMSLSNERPCPQPERSLLYHLLVDITRCSNETLKSSTVALCLYKKSPGGSIELMSETYNFDISSRNTNGLVFESPGRTLFTDLSSAEVNEPGKRAMVYLAIKVYTNESPLLIEAAPADSSSNLDGTTPPGSAGGNAASRNTNPRGNRRSLMWSQKSRKDSEGSPLDSAASKTESPVSPNSPHPEPNPEAGAPLDEKLQKPVKRLSGLGIVEVSKIFSTLHDVEREVTLQPPSLFSSSMHRVEQDLHDAISGMMGNITTHFGRHGSPPTLSMHIKAFRHPNSEALIQATPTLLHNITPTQRIEFVDTPTKPRSDIYLTFKTPSSLRNGFLSHPRNGGVPIPRENGMRNLQLTIEIRNSSGERVPNCIFPSANGPGHTAWRTVAVERNESWNQAVRLAIRPEHVPGCHIVMSVADAPNFPFALCWMPLWVSDAFVKDGEHTLVLYKYDEHTSRIVGGKGAYLSLPWSSSKLKDETVTGPIASVKVDTLLCSTAFSQDPILLGLLRWRDQKSVELGQLLRNFSFVPEIEIVKLLNEVFDALFEILVEHASNEDLEDAVFSALITVLGIVNDRRFNLQPLLDHYARTRFKYPFAFPCLLRSFIRLLRNPTSSEYSRRLRSTCKVGTYVLKFMINARQQQIGKEVGIGIKSHPPTFAREFQGFFSLAENLLRNETPVLVGTRTLMVQHLHTWLPELKPVMSSDEVLTIATGLVEACADVQGRLILYKLLLIKNLTNANLFTTSESREEWQSSVRRWLDPYWGTTESVTMQFREQVRLCCSVIYTLFSQHGSDTTVWIPKLVKSYQTLRPHKYQQPESFSPLFPTAYPFPSRPTNSTEKYDEALVEISILLSSSSNIPAADYLHLKSEDFTALLFDMLEIFQSILNLEAFPSSWLSLMIMQHKSVLQYLETMFNILKARYLPSPDDASDFNDELWKVYLSALLKLVASDALALETFPEQKRRAVWKIGGDIREFGAELLSRSWLALGWETNPEEKHAYSVDRLGGYQVSYVPALVGPILELCLSVHEGLRSVAVEVLHTMIIGEWTLNQNLDSLQAVVIDDLDSIYKEKPLNDGKLQKLFINDLEARIEPLSTREDKDFYHATRKLLNTIGELLDLLVSVYVPEASGDAIQILDTLRLLQYLKDIEKVDIYVGYVHKLSDIQKQAKNPTEAALALKLHADLHEWDTSTMLPALSQPRFPSQSKFERKEQIYFEMIGMLEDGHAWQHALSAYSELSTQYQNHMFDFAKLARAQRAMANIYERLGRTHRPNSRFFRVIFRGLGFPTNLRDRQFIFQASSNDRLSSFTDKIQQQYPSSHIVGSGQLEEIEGQYLSIYPVSAQRDYSHPVNRRPKVAQPIKDYFMLASPTKFSHTTRRHGSSGVRDQVQEKIVYTTSEPFPTITRRSEVIGTETVQMTPVQIGLERTSRKTQDLKALATAVQEGGETAVTNMTETMMLLVNSRSTGTVAGYWELVADSDDDANGESEEHTYKAPRGPLEEALRVALIDHVLTIQRCLELYSWSAPQATRAELMKGLLPTYPSHLSYPQFLLSSRQLNAFRTDLEITFAPVLPHVEAYTPHFASQSDQTSGPKEVKDFDARPPQNSQSHTSPASASLTEANSPVNTSQYTQPQFSRPQPSQALSSHSNVPKLTTPAPNPHADSVTSPGLQVTSPPPEQVNSGSSSFQDVIKRSESSHRNNSGPNGTTAADLPPTSTTSGRKEHPPRTDSSRQPSSSSVVQHPQGSRQTSSNSVSQQGQPSRQSRMQGRMGSVTKRLSALNVGRKGGKGSLRNPGVGSVAEQ